VVFQDRPVEEWERSLQDYLSFCNRRRLHSGLGYMAPNGVCSAVPTAGAGLARALRRYTRDQRRGPAEHVKGYVEGIKTLGRRLDARKFLV
jgi:hypothetical protein